MPPRVFGHALVVVVCLVVAFVGRTSRLSDQFGFGSIGSTGVTPSALVNPGSGQLSDALVRPVLADTQAATAQSLQITHYQTQAGDSIAALADRFDISENTILWTNPIAPDGHLDPGQELVILPVSGVLYTVRDGDTLAAIAQRFQSDTDSIAALNQLIDPTHPATGVQLIIPGGRLDASVRPAVSSRSIARPVPARGSDTSRENPPPLMLTSPAATPVIANPIDLIDHNPISRRLVAPIAAPVPLVPITYNVVDGDTLSTIADKFGVSSESIAAASGLQGSVDALGIDQKLVIPPVPGAVHVVQDGDTLDAVAQRYSADAADIIKANVLSEPYVLQVGQTLVVPNGKITLDAAVPAPAAPQTTYAVQEGDTVSSIAGAFGVDMQSLIDLNSLSDPYILQPGQQIQVHGPAQTTTSSASRPAPPAQPATAPATAAPVRSAPVVVAAPARPVVVAAAAPVAAPSAAPATSLGWSIVATASRYLGYPYVWGGVSPSGFDCSGFVYYVYRRAGNPIPRDMWGQLQSGSRVSRANLLPGDIVFFANTYGYGLSHDGIYIGGGRFIHAADYGIGIEVSSLSNAYYAAHYYGATRAW